MTKRREWPTMLIAFVCVIVWGWLILQGFEYHKGQHPEQYITSHNLIGGK